MVIRVIVAGLTSGNRKIKAFISPNISRISGVGILTKFKGDEMRTEEEIKETIELLDMRIKHEAIIGEAITCDESCAMRNILKWVLEKEKPINSGYPLLADVLAEFESEAYLDNNINDWVIDFNTVKLLLSKYFR